MDLWGLQGINSNDVPYDPFFAARFVKTIMQEVIIAGYNTVTWIGSMAQSTYNPVRSIATKVQGEDGYYQIDKTFVSESPIQRLAGVLDPLGFAGTFTGGGSAFFLAKSAPAASLTQTLKGGKYKDLVSEPGQMRHHMPAKSVSPLSTEEGPAIVVDNFLDHYKTSSWGNSKKAQEYRKQQKQLINEGKFDEAQQMDIQDLKEKFGDKYDEHVKQMLQNTGNNK